MSSPAASPQISYTRYYLRILISRSQNQLSESPHVVYERLITIEELQTQPTRYQLPYDELDVGVGRWLQVRGIVDQLALTTEGSHPTPLTRLSSF